MCTPRTPRLAPRPTSGPALARAHRHPSDPPRPPVLSRRLALLALTRGDEAEFTRRCLDLASLRGAAVEAVRRELRASFGAQRADLAFLEEEHRGILVTLAKGPFALTCAGAGDRSFERRMGELVERGLVAAGEATYELTDRGWDRYFVLVPGAAGALARAS